MNKFIEIKDRKQLDEFMNQIWNFHDSVISKINYVSGSYGSRKGSYAFDDKRELVVRFEGLHFNEKIVDALELKFSKLEKAFISPCQENYTTNIMCAKIELRNNRFIFVNDNSFDIDTIITNEKFYYYIVAEKLYYRIKSK